MRDRRFTLRTLLAAIVILAVLLACVRSIDSVREEILHWGSWSKVAWGPCLIAAFALTRFLGPTVQTYEMRLACSALLTVAITSSLYLAWAYYRWMDFPLLFDQGFPYPDRATAALYVWLDSRDPAPLSNRRDDPYGTVVSVLGQSVLVSLSMAGGLIGVLSRTEGPVRTDYPKACRPAPTGPTSTPTET